MINEEALKAYLKKEFKDIIHVDITKLGSGVQGSGFLIEMKTQKGVKSYVVKTLLSEGLGHVLTMILSAAGSVLIGFASSSFGVMLAWLFIYSMGQHLFMPLASTIGMELAREGQAGRRLGQLNGIRNLAAVMGSFSVVLGFKYLGFTFQHTFAISALLLAVAAVLMYLMNPEQVIERRGLLQLHKEYRLYYILNVLSGARKQLFITFAPWVLVSVLGQPTQIMATLFTIGGVIGILFQPLLGWAIDKLGERTVLASEAVILIFVCFGYGFAKKGLDIKMPGHLTEALRTNRSGGKTVAQLLAEAAREISFMSMDEVAGRLSSGNIDLVLLDVREKEAFDAGHLPGALHLPRGQLELRVDKELPDPSVRILTYCQLGRVSTLAAATLRAMGYTRAVALDGGYNEWVKAGYPTEAPQPQ